MQEKIQIKILNAALKEVPTSGWTDESLKKACSDIGLDKHCYRLYFPEGIAQVVDLYFSQLDQQMVKQIKKLPLQNMKIRERIKEAVLIRLKLLAPHKKLVARTMSFLNMPWNYALGLKMLWRTTDLIWYEAGNDSSTDFNYYTKRSLLGGVYINTIMYFLNDSSLGFKDTIDFLERKLENVISMGKFISKFYK